MEFLISIKDNYGLNISSKKLAEQIYSNIKNNTDKQTVILDFDSITSITTYCASQIFGQLYYELGEKLFFDKIKT